MNWPRWKFIQLLIAHVTAFVVACLKSLVKKSHNLIWDRISLYDLIAIVVFFNQWQLFREIEVAGILWRGQRTASCFLTMRHTMDSRDRVEKIVQVKNLKRWKFEEKWKFLRRPIKEWFRIRNPSNWEWMKIWKMTILNGQTKEWCWMRNVSKLKIDENLKDENFKWPNWGMILKQMPQTRKWKKMSSFWWQNSEK